MKTVLITGISGQDGRLLAEELAADPKVRIIGTTRNAETARHLYASRHPDIASRVEIAEIPDHAPDALQSLLASAQPHEIYNFAAPTFVGDSWKQPLLTLNDIAGPLLTMMEHLRGRVGSPSPSRLFHASSAEIFGLPWQVPQSETCPVQPRNPYGAAKAYAHQLLGIYREQYGIFAVSGILYNHESKYRGANFVTMKVCRGVAEFLRTGKSFAVGNLEARRDWGCGREFVQGMRAALATDIARDYVFATGRTNSVREFVECCLRAAEIPFQWEGQGLSEVARDQRSGQVIVAIDAAFYRPREDAQIVGNSELLRLATGWKPVRTLDQIVRDMMTAALKAPGS